MRHLRTPQQRYETLQCIPNFLFLIPHDMKSTACHLRERQPKDPHNLDFSSFCLSDSRLRLSSHSTPLTTRLSFTQSIHPNLLLTPPLLSDTSSRTTTSMSKPTAFPSSLRQRLRSDVQTISDEERRNNDAVTQQSCEKCGRDEVRFYTQQLRGADEGSTVFYRCECGHK